MEDVKYAIMRIDALIEPTTLKIITSAIVAILYFLFGNLHVEALVAIAMLMSFDTVLGMLASYNEGKEITSRRFSRAVLKGIVYYMAISAGYFADLTLQSSGVAFIQATMIGFVGVTEFISILENLGRMGYKTPKSLLNQLKDKYHDSK
jgi:toxin secretion/phage lysis holin